MGTLRTVGELYSFFFVPMTEGEYPLIVDPNLVDDMFTDECIDNTIECRQVHFFGIDEVIFQLSECERISLLEKTLDMAPMDSREHKYFYNIDILCIFLQMQIYLCSIV